MKGILLLSILFLASCSASNMSYVKAHAEETWESIGFKIVGYEGYEWSSIMPFTDYGGACVWYMVRKPGNNITYDGCLKRWGEEVHVYNMHAMDAIRPRSE